MTDVELMSLHHPNHDHVASSNTDLLEQGKKGATTDTFSPPTTQHFAAFAFDDTVSVCHLHILFHTYLAGKHVRTKVKSLQARPLYLFFHLFPRVRVFVGPLAPQTQSQIADGAVCSVKGITHTCS